MENNVTQKMSRMKELVGILNEAGKAYYQENREIMSNLEYDRLYDELLDLEKSTGFVFSQSPTQHVGYELLSELPKEPHESPMLSLDKTKDREELAKWLGEEEGLLSWKLDGLTIVLTYKEGSLFKAVTRGNGEVGEVITNNAKVFANIPLQIPYKGELVLRGEAVISYETFQKINRQMGDAEAKYKNPRNLCSGSVRQLNNEITAERDVHFIAFALVKAPGVDLKNSQENAFLWMKSQGFDVVEYRRVTKETIGEAIAQFEKAIPQNPYPSDGLVLLYDNIVYGKSLGRTAKFPRDSIAFKWEDERQETTLSHIEWSPSRTGLINPVAVFAPVELEGTTVSRASVHNVSILKELKLGEGDRILVYKANMIIPQIAENLTCSDTVKIPEACPVCGGKTSLRDGNGVQSLYCTNPDCQAKKVKSFVLFASRDAMNIDGMSEATLEKMIGAGFIHDFADLYHLKDHREEIVNMEGFGEKSYEKLAAAIENARNTTLPRLIYSLGIPGIGPANAKNLCRAFGNDLTAIMEAQEENLAQVDGIGEVLAHGIHQFFAQKKTKQLLNRLLGEIVLQKEEGQGRKSLSGKTFVITGSLIHYANRSAFKEALENAGAKVTGSVTAKTDYLINNDKNSTSSKNKKARELGIPVLSEEEAISLLEGEKEDAH